MPVASSPSPWRTTAHGVVTPGRVSSIRWCRLTGSPRLISHDTSSIMPRTLLFVGETPERSSPSLTAARVLKERAGYDFIFSERREFGSTRAWVQLLRACDAVVVVLYDPPVRFLRRQIALATLLSKPVVRWWVGSDVL